MQLRITVMRAVNLAETRHNLAVVALVVPGATDCHFEFAVVEGLQPDL